MIMVSLSPKNINYQVGPLFCHEYYWSVALSVGLEKITRQRVTTIHKQTKKQERGRGRKLTRENRKSE